MQTADWIPLDVRQKIIELVSGDCWSASANSYSFILVHLDRYPYSHTVCFHLVFLFYGEEQEPHQQGRGASGDVGAQQEPAAQP